MIAKVNVGTNVTLVQAAQGRGAIALQNQSDTDIFVALDGSTDVSIDSGSKPGIKIAPGATLTMHQGEAFAPALSKAIYAIHGGSGSKVLVLHAW